MKKTGYQYGFSELHKIDMYDVGKRRQKAAKMIAVLKDVLPEISKLKLLDIGCSTGIMTNFYADHFAMVTGIDIDRDALDHAVANYNRENLDFKLVSADETGFLAGSFDVISCTHIYEHVPDPKRMLNEIHRLLKPGGICYFVAGNRLKILEAHYHLPLLSILPKWAGHIYLRLAGRGNYYYENHLTFWGLRKLTSGFKIIDYTKKIIADPEKYNAEEMIRPGSLKQQLSLVLVNLFYFLCPTYVWILRKD